MTDTTGTKPFKKELAFDREGGHALIEVEFTSDGRLSISGRVKSDASDSAGQCYDHLLETFPRSKRAKRLVEIWKRWHLNDMHAGCEHQRAAKWTDVRIESSELPENYVANRDNDGVLAVWVYPKEHPNGLLTKPCETCGYEYGTSWLFEEVPQSILDELRGMK